MLFQIKPKKERREITPSSVSQLGPPKYTKSLDAQGTSTHTTLVGGDKPQPNSAPKDDTHTDVTHRASSVKGSHNQVLFGDLNINMRNVAIIGGILVFGFYIYKSAIGDGVLIQQNGVTTRRNVMIWIDVVIATSLAFLIIKFSRTLLRGV